MSEPQQSGRVEGRRGGVFRNTLQQSSSTLLSFVLSFVLAPILISRLGLAAFGLWAVTGAIFTYAGLADLGISNSLSRFVALYDARGDERSIKECVGLGLIIVIVVGVIASALAWVLAPLAVQEFGVVGTGDMRIVMLSAVGILTSSICRMVFNSVGIGLRRMGPPNVASAINSIANFGFSVGILAVSSKLTDYAIANAAAGFVGVVAGLIALRFIWRPIPVAMPSRRLTREVLGFSLKSQVTSLANIVNLQTDKIIIAAIVGVKVTAAYELGARVVLGATTVAQLAVSALIPTATAFIESRGRQVIAGFYRRYVTLTIAVSMPILVVCCVSAPFLLRAWLGESPHNAVPILIVLGIAYIVNNWTAVAYTVAMSEGQVGLIARNQALIAGLNILFTLALSPLFDVWGVLVGTFLAISLGSGLMLRSIHRAYDLTANDFWGAAWRPIGLSAGVALPLLIVDLIIAPSVSGRPANVAALISVSAIYSVGYWILASRAGVLPQKLTLGRVRRREAPVAAGAAAP